jgi:hypothetical protein
MKCHACVAYSSLNNSRKKKKLAMKTNILSPKFLVKKILDIETKMLEKIKYLFVMPRLKSKLDL